jgi:hypothetical protein
VAYLTIARIAGEPSALLAGYRRTSALMDGVGRDHGLILHAGAETPDGLLIVNLWPSRDESDAAAADPPGPAAQGAPRGRALRPVRPRQGRGDPERRALSLAARRRGYELRSASVTSWSTDTWST